MGDRRADEDIRPKKGAQVMKKRRYVIPLLIVLILAALIAADAALSLHQDFENYPSRSLPGDPRAADRIAVLTVGDYPGMRDDPVTEEEAAPGHEALALLRSQSYLMVPLWPRPREGGIEIYNLSGCTPEPMAYWDGSLLWIPGKYTGKWRAHIPLSDPSLGEKLDTYCN